MWVFDLVLGVSHKGKRTITFAGTMFACDYACPILHNRCCRALDEYADQVNGESSSHGRRQTDSYPLSNPSRMAPEIQRIETSISSGLLSHLSIRVAVMEVIQSDQIGSGSSIIKQLVL